MRHVALKDYKMTDKELLKDLNERISLQQDLINRYANANSFAPNFYYEELYQMCAERDKLMRKMQQR